LGHASPFVSSFATAVTFFNGTIQSSSSTDTTDAYHTTTYKSGETVVGGEICVETEGGGTGK
jgi:hypothetical protein